MLQKKSNWCIQAEQTRKELEVMEMQGEKLDFDLAEQVFLCDYMCNRHYKEREWNERMALYLEPTHVSHREDAEKAKHVHSVYSHSHNCCDADLEMQRIIDTGNIEMMHKLSGILSEHFEDVAMISPKVYHKLVEKMKGVKY